MTPTVGEFTLKASKGAKPRPGASYRGARRNAAKVIRKAWKAAQK